MKTKIKLKGAIMDYATDDMDKSILAGQEKAFCYCLDFLSEVKAIKTQNGRRSSYGYKHWVESPWQQIVGSIPPEIHTTYVYEGTFILAAVSLGFKRSRIHNCRIMTSDFNFSETSLRPAIKSYYERVAKKQSQ